RRDSQHVARDRGRSRRRLSGRGLLLRQCFEPAAVRGQSAEQADGLLRDRECNRDAGRLHPDSRDLQLRAPIPRHYGDERHRHLRDPHDELDAFGLAMRTLRAAKLVRCERGATAAEFAVLFPVLVSTLLGIIWASLLAYSAASLHYAVEGAARCYSVESQCA